MVGQVGRLTLARLAQVEMAQISTPRHKEQFQPTPA